jgi:hypothetical protein
MNSRGDRRPRFGDADLGATRRGIVAGTIVLVIPFAIIAFLLCLMLGIRGWIRIPVVLGFGSAAAFAVVRSGVGFADAMGRFVARFVAPSGSTTPYEYGFSYEQALAIKGDVTGALESYEILLRAAPHDVEAHVNAAELYASSGNAARAIELFRALRAIDGVGTARDVYASNRLIDLYLGAAGDDGRALVELRRLIECHPGTDTAARAREALGRLKAARNG